MHFRIKKYKYKKEKQLLVISSSSLLQDFPEGGGQISQVRQMVQVTSTGADGNERRIAWELGRYKLISFVA